jgi:predicted  nucleic acid-binding Zn-ribbon protein
VDEVTKIVTIAVSLVVSATPAVAWLISFHFKKQKEIETLKASNTKSALNRLDDEVKAFRASIDSIQFTVKELNASLVQNRSDVLLLKERLDDTKKLLEQYEKNHDGKVKNLIKTEITELTKQLMLIRQKKAP